MNFIDIKETSLRDSVQHSKSERFVMTRRGKPVALTMLSREEWERQLKRG